MVYFGMLQFDRTMYIIIIYHLYCYLLLIKIQFMINRHFFELDLLTNSIVLRHITCLNFKSNPSFVKEFIPMFKKIRMRLFD